MADHPLRSATHRRLGGPLPHQLANAPRAHPAVAAEAAFPYSPMRGRKLSGISSGFPELSRSAGQVAHVLLTRPPLKLTGASSRKFPLDLHVLGTPPAFVLSQDQTLHYRDRLIAQTVLANHRPKTRGRLICESLISKLLLTFCCSVFKVQVVRRSLAT